MPSDHDLPLPSAAEFEHLLLGAGAVVTCGEAFAGLTASTHSQTSCPRHPDSDDCLCHGFVEDYSEFDLPTTGSAGNDGYLGLEEPDYSKFENWIPRLVRPERPCDYCASRRLICLLDRDTPSCKSCQSLFRECSFIRPKQAESNNQPGVLLDTLSVVDENACEVQGTWTGVKALKSLQGRVGGTSTPSVRLDDAPGSGKRNGIRFPKHAVKLLREWLDSHADHPYPSEEEKVELEKATDLKPMQIANWLANARRRRKAADKVRTTICNSPSLRPSTPALPIPKAADKPWEELNPFERWKHSPPEHEPAAITDIAHAIANADFVDDVDSASPSTPYARYKRSSNGSGSRLSNLRAPSITSVGSTSAHSSTRSGSSAAYSHNTSHSLGSYGSFSSSLAGKRDRKRRRRPVSGLSRKPSDEKPRIFQCTFCTDTFKFKYDWTRHEKTLHLSLDKWICHPLGPVVTDPKTNRKRCTFCDTPDPSDEHLETHNYRQCEDKGIDARTFYRKDHLRQHLRLMHGCSMIDSMDLWRSVAVNINCRCGFCSQRFTSWHERTDHLAAHFKAGAKMADWRGCRGFDPAVAAQVTNAMPPYLIGIESVSPHPFSASNRATWRDTVCIGNEEAGPTLPGDLSGHHIEDASAANAGTDDSRATCWEVLTVRLGKYANEMAKQGVVLSDAMLQEQARRILFDSDDSWNQTAADNPEWLDLFKKAHGLDFIPSTIGGQGAEVPSDLETYGDLGLRIPFAVQLQAYNQQLRRDEETRNESAVQHNDKERGAQIAFQALYSRLSEQGLLHDVSFRCGHTECAENVADIGWLQDGSNPSTFYTRWCSRELSTEVLKVWPAFVNWANTKTASETMRQTGNANARASCLEFLARLEASQAVDCLDPMPNRKTHNESKKTCFPRHRYELPHDRAKRFETVTGAWPDSGTMPNPTRTSTVDATTPGNSLPLPSIIDQQNTSTGAMMEFLGGNIGANLPFSTDTATSTIPLPLMEGLTNGGAPVEILPADDEFMKELDQFIAATTASQSAGGCTTAPLDGQAWASSLGLQSDNFDQTESVLMDPGMAMEDLDFDEMTFGTDYNIEQYVGR